jgi:hypothetical protein
MKKGTAKANSPCREAQADTFKFGFVAKRDVGTGGFR